MIGHTYRFFKGDVLYPFGYGLSYTSFDYSNFTVPENVKAGDTLMVMVTVKNSGSRDGEEVVQVYASKLNDSAAPLRNLVAFKRVFIKQGEEKEILLKIRPESFTTVTNDGERKFIPAEFLLTAGGGQPLKGIKTLSSILSIN
jgi:beta-glucosidase